MSDWIWILIAVYVVGFAVTLAFNLAIGPLTFSLCLFRALVWPIFWITGWPHGTPLTMD